MAICEKCNREINDVYYINGKGYSHGCFKLVTGMTPAEYSYTKRMENEEEAIKDFLMTNPTIYVCVTKDLFNKTSLLKLKGFQYHNGWWIGFNKRSLDDLMFLEFETKKYFQGWSYYSAYSFKDNQEDKNDGISLYRDIKDILEKMSTGKYIGQIKERIEIEVTLKEITGYSNGYGWIRMYIFNTDEGDILTWETTKDTDWKDSQRIKIKATISEHGYDNGKKRTGILRVKEI